MEGVDKTGNRQVCQLYLIIPDSQINRSRNEIGLVCSFEGHDYLPRKRVFYPINPVSDDR